MADKKVTTNKEEQLQALVQLQGTVLGRMKMMSQLGQQYAGNRDIYHALGYKKDLQYEDYLSQYARQDIAKAIIKRPVKATWRGGVSLFEGDETSETALEKTWTNLYKGLQLQSKFSRLDRLTGLGEYAVLLLGMDDTKQVEDFTQPVSPGNRKLYYVKPFGMDSAQIKEYEDDPNNERYGLPKYYQIKSMTPNSKRNQEVRVHHSRVIHVADDLLESDVLGIPRLQEVFNRLKDLEKIVGGSGEMFWRGARPGYHGKVDKDFHMGSEEQEELETQLDEYEHNLRRFLVGTGVDINSLQTQVADPSKHVDVQLQMISAVTGIPKRILVGSERGELASTEDNTQWNSLIQARREEFAEPHILVPFIQKGMEYGFLPEARDEYGFQWQDLFAPSDKERAEVGKTRSDALSAYTKQPAAQEVVPPEAFYRLFLGLDDEDIEQIEAIRLEYNQLEDREIEQDNEPEEET